MSQNTFIVLAILFAVFILPAIWQLVSAWGQKHFGEQRWHRAGAGWLDEGDEAVDSDRLQPLEKRVEALEGLAERVATLEAIVTDQRYALHREFESLKRDDN